MRKIKKYYLKKLGILVKSFIDNICLIQKQNYMLKWMIFVPDFETASNLVREAGGLVFIPHIYEYKKNSEPILEHILKIIKLMVLNVIIQHLLKNNIKDY